MVKSRRFDLPSATEDLGFTDDGGRVTAHTLDWIWKIMLRYFVTVFAVASSLAGTAFSAEQSIPFDASWREQGFLRLFTNDYSMRGAQLDVTSDGTVSLLWRPVDASARAASEASWIWRVSQGVRPTDLTLKGGDDRNLALYFVFVDEKTAATLSNNSMRRLLQNPETRAIIYVWGGSHETGAILPSPYHPGLRTKVLRVAPLGQFRETVDLRADYREAFGAEPEALIGIAVSADSDDTDGEIRASIANLTIR